MKTFVRLLTTKYEECECSSVGLKRTWQIKTLSVVARARVEANLTSYMMCGFFKQIMLYFQWKILFWLLPTVWWMIMFIIVSYLLGWPHKKLTMSLIDLFPSANDVSTEPHSVARVHSGLLAIIDSYYLPLMIILIICCEQEEYHLITLPQNICCCEALTDSSSSDRGLQCLWHGAGHWTIATGRRDSG